MGVPQNWHDTGTVLTAPNGAEVVLGFRQYVLTHDWDSGNYPLGAQFYTQVLESSNPALGDGDQQVFRDSLLGYPHNPQAPYQGLKEQVIEEWAGVELAYTRQQLATYYNEYKAAQARIASLTEQLKMAQQPTGIAETTVKDRLTAIGLAATNGNAAVQQLVNQPLS